MEITEKINYILQYTQHVWLRDILTNIKDQNGFSPKQRELINKWWRHYCRKQTLSILGTSGEHI